MNHNIIEKNGESLSENDLEILSKDFTERVRPNINSDIIVHMLYVQYLCNDDYERLIKLGPSIDKFVKMFEGGCIPKVVTIQ
jgi:hypothetical protein